MKPVIGIPLRYAHSDDGHPILYLGEKVRRTFQRAGAEVFFYCACTGCRLY